MKKPKKYKSKDIDWRKNNYEVGYKVGYNQAIDDCHRSLVKGLEEMSFESFLMDKHADQYVGTDDMMPDDYNDWVRELEVDTLIEYGNQHIKKIIKWIQQE